MKKSVCLLVASIVMVAQAVAQRRVTYSKQYFAEIESALSLKKYYTNGPSQNSILLKGTGVYDWFFWQVARNQPLTKAWDMDVDEPETVATIGYGSIQRLPHCDLRVGIGLTGMMKPRFITRANSTTDYFAGLTGYANVESEEAELQMDMSLKWLHYLPENNTEGVANNLFVPELHFTKFFGKQFGVGLGYELLINTATNGNNSTTAVDHTFTPFLSFKKNWLLLRTGPVIRRSSLSSYDYWNNSGGSYAENKPMGFFVGVVLQFAN